MQGTVVGLFTVTSEFPTRGRKGLEWDCTCPAGHTTRIEHSLLVYGAVTQQCQQCAQEAHLHKAAAKLAEQQAANYALREWQAAQKAARAAQFAEQEQVKEGVEANV
jgi:hypothetical protein